MAIDPLPLPLLEIAERARREVDLLTREIGEIESLVNQARTEATLSHSTPVERGLRNAYFAERGLESLADRWKEHHTWDVTAPATVPG